MNSKFVALVVVVALVGLARPAVASPKAIGDEALDVVSEGLALSTRASSSADVNLQLAGWGHRHHGHHGHGHHGHHVPGYYVHRRGGPGGRLGEVGGIEAAN